MTSDPVPGRADPPIAGASPILALATSGGWCSVALLWADTTAPIQALALEADSAEAIPAGTQLACLSEPAGMAHSQRLLPMAHELLRQAGLSMRELGLIAFDAGPGGFTSLRIGCGIAQGLALGIGCPVVPVTSLQALAWPHRRRPCLSAIDARMGEVYFAAWNPGAGQPIGRLAVGSPESLERLMGERPILRGASGDDATERPQAAAWVATGDAFARYPQLAARAAVLGAAVHPQDYPRADAIARLAACARAAGQTIAADDAAPVYVRDKVALDVDEQRAQRSLREGSR